MKQPTELMTMFIIPGIRNQIVKELKILGLKQEEIARIFDITPSAVSQYIKDKRGSEVEFCSNFLKRLKMEAKKIYNNLSDDLEVNKKLVFKTINELSLFYRKKKMLCPMCKIENEIDNCNTDCK